METPTDFLLFFDSNEIFVNYSFSNFSHCYSFLPLIKLKALDSSKKLENIDNLSRIFKLPYAFLISELKRLTYDFQTNKIMKFPINLTKVCNKWKAISNSKSFCESLGAFKRKNDSNETRSTDNEDPFVFSLTPDEHMNLDQDSVILLDEKDLQKESINIHKKPFPAPTKKDTNKSGFSDYFNQLDIEIPIEVSDLEKIRKKVKTNGDVSHQESQDHQTNINLNIQEDFQFLPVDPENLKEDFSMKTLNEIDSESVPDFIYVTENLMLDEVAVYFENAHKTFKNSIKTGSFQIVCDCKGSCNEDCICARYNKQYLNKCPPYKLVKNSNHKVVQKEIIQEHIKPFSHIFECSKYCSCNKDLCTYQLLNWNRLRMVSEKDLIVKRYRKCFKGTNEEIVMWGLMSTKRIPNNTLVIEYLGEIIIKEEADLRGKYYDKIGKNYLFDMTMAVEYKGENKSGPIFCIDNYMKCRKTEEKEKLLKDFPLCIDGYYYGNLSRFINHSCDPNLQVLSIHVENREILLPRVVLFSTREIKAGEELTFDYNCYPLSTDKELKCACGAESCRGVIYN